MLTLPRTPPGLSLAADYALVAAVPLRSAGDIYSVANSDWQILFTISIGAILFRRIGHLKYMILFCCVLS